MSGRRREDEPSPIHHTHDRFFFAVRPDSDAAAAIDAFAARTVPDGRRVPLQHQHVTLALTEDVPTPAPELVTRLIEAGAKVEGKGFDLVLDRLSVTRRTAALAPSDPPEALMELQRRIVASMTDLGVSLRRSWHFNPHQTLCYRRGVPFVRPVDGFVWRARELALVRSLIGMGRHETIGRWPLGGEKEG